MGAVSAKRQVKCPQFPSEPEPEVNISLSTGPGRRRREGEWSNGF